MSSGEGAPVADDEGICGRVGAGSGLGALSDIFEEGGEVV